MAHKLIKYLALIGLSLITTLSWASWDLVKESHNVKLFRSTAESDQFTSRIEAEVNVSIETLKEVIEDPNACDMWLFRCQTAHHISKTDDDHLYLYYIRDYPFPLKDRHGVLQLQTTQETNGEFVLTFQLRQSMTPEESTLIVPDLFSAQIRLVRLDENRSKIYLEHQLNPGGTIPNWLKKSIHEEFPFNSVLGLIESAQSKRLEHH
jgi:hypothetical protein